MSGAFLFEIDMNGRESVPIRRAASVAAVALSLCLAVMALPARATDDEECLACHEGMSGDQGAVAGDLHLLAESLHGSMGISCVDCHADLVPFEGMHGEDLAPADCASCHADSATEHLLGAHRDQSCSACHGAHDIRRIDDPQSPLHHLRVSDTCAECHGQMGDQPRQFRDGVHAHGLEKAGLTVAPSCVSCHGAHEALPSWDEDSSVHRSRVTATCGQCHQGLLPAHASSVHAADRSGGEGATCADCHAAHDTMPAGIPGWRRDVIAQCGECHASMVDSFHEGFHGKATQLGYERAAMCSDCHGAHDIQAIDHPDSRVGQARIVETCRQCHEDATLAWASYDPHVDLENAERNPQAYWARKFMDGLPRNEADSGENRF